MEPIEPAPRTAGLRIVLTAVLTAACVIVPMVLGLLEPTSHVAQHELVLPEPRSEVYERLVDLGNWPRWNPYLGPMRAIDETSFETRPDPDSRLIYVLVGHRAPERVVVDLRAHPRRLGARWTFELSETSGGTRVRMTEQGWTSSPSMRFIMRYVAGYDVALVGIARALESRGSELGLQPAEGTSPP